MSRRFPLRGTSDGLDQRLGSRVHRTPSHTRLPPSDNTLGYYWNIVLRFFRHFEIYSQSQHTAVGIFSPSDNDPRGV